MNIYRITFVGRLRIEHGSFYIQTETIEANSQQEAIDKLSDTWETNHIQNVYHVKP